MALFNPSPKATGVKWNRFHLLCNSKPHSEVKLTIQLVELCQASNLDEVKESQNIQTSVQMSSILFKFKCMLAFNFLNSCISAVYIQM